MKQFTNANPGSGGDACAAARVQASAWIDGELPDASAWNAHLARCADCRAHVQELRRTTALLAPLRCEEVVQDLWPRIAASVLATRAHARPSWTTRVARLAAAFVGFAGTAYVLGAATQARRNGLALPETETPSWTAALHAPQQDLRGLESTAERRLLAALERTAEEGR